MPDSNWTESGSSISLTPTTSTLAGGSSPADVNYLTNAYKITLVAQYAAELATKTSLDTTASALSIPTSFYDATVATISPTLVHAGAPSNWATTWPDGTTFGPVAGIQATLSSDWASIAAARTSLQSAISAAQASASAATAQAAAVATAATDATSKMTAAIAAAAAVPTVVSRLPTLPSSSYPSGAFVFNSATGIMYQSTGSNWTPVTVAGSSIAANSITANQVAAGAIGATQIAANSIVASKLVITDTTNLCGNPSADGTLGLDGWSGGVTGAVGAPCYLGNANCLNQTNRDGFYGNIFTVVPGDSYRVHFDACPDAWSNNPAGDFTVGFVFTDQSGNVLAYTGSGYNSRTHSGSWATTDGIVTVPSGAFYARVWSQINAAAGATGGWFFRSVTINKATNGQLLVDGSITAPKIAAGAITADMVTTGTLNAANVNLINLNASNITTGTLSAAKVLFADGSSMNTAARVLTSLATLSTQTTSPGYGYVLPLGELGFTTVTESTDDTYNLFLNVPTFNTAGPISAVLWLYVIIDYDKSSPRVAWAVTPTGAMTYSGTIGATVSMTYFSLFGSITGLSAGAHTIQIYIEGPANWIIQGGGYTPATVLMQRIY